jgi:hypothetical protein
LSINAGWGLAFTTTTIRAVPLWIVEARTGESFWEVAAVAGDKAMAQALQAELEHDGYAARVCEREGLAPHEAEAVHRQIENRSADQRARWEPYYYRAAARLQGMDEASFLARMRSRTAEAAIGTSALPSVGAVGVIAAARRALLEVDLARLSASSTVEALARELDAATEAVRAMLPGPADRWGNARKAANLYLRDVLYNSYLAPAYGFDRIEHWLELPLEEETVIELRHRTTMPLPRWPGMHRMDPDLHLVYQDAAMDVANQLGLARVHLDIHWWRSVGGERSDSTV